MSAVQIFNKFSHIKLKVFDRNTKLISIFWKYFWNGTLSVSSKLTRLFNGKVWKS
jgi:hypothetical protein